MGRSKYLLGLLGVLALYGCENDSDGRVACKDHDVCLKDGGVCLSGFCDYTPAEPGKCRADVDCADRDEDHKTCLAESKVCGKYIGFGHECVGVDDVECEPGLGCHYKCVYFLNENQKCNGYDEDHVCDLTKNLQCKDELCVEVVSNLEEGKSCDGVNKTCANGLTCYARDKGQPDNKTCTKVVKLEDDCDESSGIFCPEGMYCREVEPGNRLCTTIGDECNRLEDCTEGDSYCCTMDSCSEVEKNHCVPYNKYVDHDETCKFETKPGIFEANIQCRWQPPKDQEPNSKSVVVTPLVGKFGNKAGLDTVVAFYSYSPITLRFINPETCETLESIKNTSLGTRWYDYPAAADLDGDGLLEIVVITASQYKPIVYKWDNEQKKHVQLWAGKAKGGVFPVIFDINGDHEPEIIAGRTVYDKDGTVLYEDTSAYNGSDIAVGFLNADDSGQGYLISGDSVLRWKKSNDGWDKVASLPIGKFNNQTRVFNAYADFGTPGATADDFNFNKLDGKPEIVVGGTGKIFVFALVPKDENEFETQTIMTVNLLRPQDGGNQEALGGPITIGDYDNDGLPEIGLASSGFYGVYDPLCESYEKGKCADKYVLWERWSQDASSGVTGSTVFDFDGDGQVEAVYADECFTRVYEGTTGRVLFSARHSSGTAHEAPVVADVDGDGSAEILMASEPEVTQGCFADAKTRSATINGVDPIHEGIYCTTNSDCPSGRCEQGIGLCECTEDDECNTQFINGKRINQYECAAPIHPMVGFMQNTDGSGRKLAQMRGTRPEGYEALPEAEQYKVCRATRKEKDFGFNDLMIYKDRLDRWVSSRSIWNQHPYNIINISDKGSVPITAQWLDEFTKTVLGKITGGQEINKPLYNSYRLNSQGKFGAGTAPDITGKFIAGSICGITKDENGKDRRVISGNLCNRGTKDVARNLPATFFYYDELAADHRGEKLCTSYTPGTLPVGVCEQVGCELTKEQFDDLIGKKVLMVSNLDEYGYPSTVECRDDNNSDSITVNECTENIKIIN